MKKGITFLIVCVITMFWACTQDEIVTNEELENNSEINKEKFLGISSKKHPLAPDIEKSQVVIQYINKEINKEEVKSFLENKYYFKVKEGGVRKCNCDDKSIELWTIDISNPKFGGVETLIGSHDVDEDEKADVNADFQFSLFVKEGNETLMREYTNSIEKMVHDNNSEDRVNIAVIDTGIDYDYFDAEFLYNASNDTSDCLGREVSGWDFVNNDYDSRDDHGHGTFVTAIIRDILNEENIPYQILPIKAFDRNGKGTYFDILCGLKHVASKNKPFLVNCSFGFYNLKNQLIFENIVERNANNLLLMASAGNDNENTDSEGSEHFPSGYKSDNVLAVGGFVDISSEGHYSSIALGDLYIGGYDLAPMSNYGNTSIDVVASFEYNLTLRREVIKDLTFSRRSRSFPTNNSIIDEIEEGISRYPLQGTSFSCPIVTARAAAVYYRNPVLPRVLKNNVINTSYRNTSLRNKIKNSNIILKGHYRVPNPIGPSPIGPSPM